jgi:membrane protein
MSWDGHVGITMKRLVIRIRELVDKNRLTRMVIATAVGWHQDRISRLSSSLSFYALLSLIPLLVTFHALFSLVLDEQTLTAGVDAQVSAFIGAEQAQAVRDMLNHARAPSFASLQAIIGSLVTFITAAGVFIELKDSMDAIWKVPKSGRSGFLAWLSTYFAPLSMVLGFAFLLLISLLLDALLSAAATTLITWNPALLAIMMGGNLVIGWLVAAVLFAGIFRWLPTTSVAWRDVWLGAAITATLFVVGRMLIGWYLGRSDFTGRYGPAGAVVALIVWIYYSAQILFTGAVFTREHARSAKRHPEPEVVPPSAPASAGNWLDDGGTARAP